MTERREDVDPEALRRHLLELATRIRQLDEAGELLNASPELIRLMGNLRSKLFEYEVRHTGRLLPKSVDLPEVAEAQRIVEEAARRMEEAESSWGQPWSHDLEEEEDT